MLVELCLRARVANLDGATIRARRGTVQRSGDPVRIKVCLFLSSGSAPNHPFGRIELSLNWMSEQPCDGEHPISIWC
jgi:hypothetical protein